VRALCVILCASCVKNTFLRIYKLFGIIIALHKCTARRTFYVLRRNRFYHSWTAVSWAVAQSVRRKTTDEK